MASPTSVKPYRGWVLVFFAQVAPSAKNGAKLVSSDRVYTRFCLQFSKLLMVSFFERLHCFGARAVVPMTVAVDWAYDRIMLERRECSKYRRICVWNE